MRKRLQHGLQELEIFSYRESRPDESYMEFPDDGVPIEFVRTLAQDDTNLEILRQALEEAEFRPDYWRMDQLTVLKRVSAKLISGELRIALPTIAAEVPGGGGGEREEEPPEEEEIPPAPPMEEPLLRLTRVDDHFVPARERLDVQYEIQNLTDKVVKIEISSGEYPANPIFERELTTGEKSNGTHTLSWDGKANCAGGGLKDRYINPLYSPYKVKLVASSGQQGRGEFKVLYHSIELRPGTYTADGAAPPKTDLVKWVQYKLNELGYFAGPVDGVKGDQTKRTIKRYTYAMPGLYNTKKEIDDETDATFKNQLERNLGRRQIFESNRLPARGQKAKLYLDHDYFYHAFSNADFSHAQGHCNKDADKLDRVEFPLEVAVKLAAKADANGTGNGILSPEAAGEVDIEWVVKDPIEDTSFLPTSTADIPSRGKLYVEAALTATGQVAGAPEDSKDNCPKTNKGQRDTNPNYFRIGDKLPPFKSESAGDKVYCKVHQDAAASPHKIGGAGILFQGSYIPGDNYVITARISFERLGNKATLTQLHETYTGKQLKDILFAETGQVTIWRRQHVAALLNWPDPSRAIAWPDVAEAYEVAHARLDTIHRVYAIEDIFSTQADKDAYLDLVANKYPAYTRADMEFDEQGLYPLSVRSQGWTEDPDDYKQFVNNLIDTFANGAGSDSFQDELAGMIYKKISLVESAGSIVFRPNWVRTVKVRRKLPILGVINPFKSEDYLPGFVCLGLPFGIALMDNGMTQTEQDGFLYPHEMGHCRYLLHHETKNTGSDNADEHDQNDHNCTMCYPNGIVSRPGLTWNKGDATESRFCGKCILKLRGWDIRDATLPAQS